MTKSIIILLLAFCAILNTRQDSFLQGRGQWTAAQANQWWADNQWFAGINFIPSTAVNTLEMWQAETYDQVTIDRELGFAASAGFKVIRVFIHHLVWQQDQSAFLLRIDNFLGLADSHGIKTMFVMFDDCWNAEGKLGTQPAPRKGVHNSQWVQAPGDQESQNQNLFPVFQDYFLDIIGHFKNDNRIYLWDIYNEPGNTNHGTKTLPLLTRAFEWARRANPSQPISSGIWSFGSDFNQMNELQLSNSDVITFHVYNDVSGTRNISQILQQRGRPTICTEYMARPIKSNFITHIPLFHELDVGAISWGLVSGKTNTIFAWDSQEGGDEPQIWFHDVLRQDGTPFDQMEIDVIRKYTGKSVQQSE